MVPLEYSSREDKNMPQRKSIVFFEDLGFGWLIDRNVLERIYSGAKNQKYSKSNIDNLFEGYRIDKS